MFNSLLLDPNDSIIADRLSRVQNLVANLNLSTKEDYLAQCFSLINSVLNLGDNMQELDAVRPRPAVVGDLINNFTILNEDAIDITTELLRLENNLGDLYNFASTNQNSLRQALRETIYNNTSSVYTEPFISKTNINTSSSATIDVNAGIACLPLNVETNLTPVISLGANSVGASSNNISTLLNASLGINYQWNGSLLEIILTFPTPTIVNRLYLGLNTYDGLEITSFTGSPDGVIFNDLLAGLGVSVYPIGAQSGKYSGDVIIDFIPTYATVVKIDISSVAGPLTFSLNNVGISNRTYQPSGSITSKPISLTGYALRFLCNQIISNPYTAITHQISADGVNYTTIVPGDLTPGLTNPMAPFYYQAVLTRSTTAFNKTTSVLTDVSPTYTIKSQSSNITSAGIVQQTINLTNITAGEDITFVNPPLADTLSVQIGSIYLAPSQYTLVGNVLTFSANQASVTIVYQTSAYVATAVQTLQNYYTPILYQTTFEVI